MSSWTFPILCSAFLSRELIIWLPSAYFCGRAWKPEAVVFTCNNCLSLHRCRTYFFPQAALHLWLFISFVSYQLTMIILKEILQCSLHVFSVGCFLIIDSFKVPHEPNIKCFPKKHDSERYHFCFIHLFLDILFCFYLLFFQKTHICANQPFVMPVQASGRSSSVPVSDDWILDKQTCEHL